MSLLASSPWSLVGRPYRVPCKPPDTFECFSLIEHVRLVYYGKPTPLIVQASDVRVDQVGDVIALHATRGRYVEVPDPSPGDIAWLSANHVGVVVDGGVMSACLTSTRGTGQVIGTTWRQTAKWFPDARYMREAD